MNISRTFNTFSKRRSKSKGVRESLTPEFRNRVLMLCYDSLSGPSSTVNEFARSRFWSAMHRELRYLHGYPTLSDRQANSAEEDVVNFLQNCSDEHFLDFVEKIFQLEPTQITWTRDHRLVNTINEFFDTDGLPYRLTKHVYSQVESTSANELGFPTGDSNLGVPASQLEAYPQAIYLENEVIHEMAIEPTLSFLTHPAFVQANKEFLEALKHYRKGEFRDCVLKCGNSFESVMKIICDRKQLPYKQTDTTSKLLKTVLSQTTLDSFFEQPIMLIATIRNRLSTAHGAGTQQKTVSKHVANFVINATASAILLLVDETNP